MTNRTFIKKTGNREYGLRQRAIKSGISFSIIDNTRAATPVFSAPVFCNGKSYNVMEKPIILNDKRMVFKDYSLSLPKTGCTSASSSELVCARFALSL